MDFSKKLKKVHFIGITSPFPSFCAQQLIDKGVEVSASELNQNNSSGEYWKNKGVLFPGAHDEKYISSNLDLVVYPTGPIPNNPECEKTEKLKIPWISVAELTGKLTAHLKTIAVAGTHGKTTTTALIVWALSQLDQIPNYILGDSTDYILGLEKNWNSSKKSTYFVVEACEYKQQFLQRAPHPFISVITNIDIDHTDYYKNQEHYNESFIKFLNNTTEAIVIDSSGNNEKDVIKIVHSNNPKIKIIDLAQKHQAKLNSILLGDHNTKNISKAFYTCETLGFSTKNTINALESFRGVSKRFEYIGKTINNNPVYRDYAHNPKKVEAVIESAKKKHPNKKLVLVFEPHSTERCFSFKSEFQKALSKADFVLITDIFSPSRESLEHKNLISTQEFVEFVKRKSKNIEYSAIENLENIIKYYDTEEIVVVIASAGKLQEVLEKGVSWVKKE